MKIDDSKYNADGGFYYSSLNDEEKQYTTKSMHVQKIRKRKLKSVQISTKKEYLK